MKLCPGMYRVKPDNGIYTFFVFIRQLYGMSRSIYLRADIYEPSIIVYGTLNYFVPIFVKSYKVNVAVYVDKLRFSLRHISLSFSLFSEIKEFPVFCAHLGKTKCVVMSLA